MSVRKLSSSVKANPGKEEAAPPKLKLSHHKTLAEMIKAHPSEFRAPMKAKSPQGKVKHSKGNSTQEERIQTAANRALPRGKRTRLPGSSIPQPLGNTPAAIRDSKKRKMPKLDRPAKKPKDSPTEMPQETLEILLPPEEKSKPSETKPVVSFRRDDERFQQKYKEIHNPEENFLPPDLETVTEYAMRWAKSSEKEQIFGLIEKTRSVSPYPEEQPKSSSSEQIGKPEEEESSERPCVADGTNFSLEKILSHPCPEKTLSLRLQGTSIQDADLHLIFKSLTNLREIILADEESLTFKSEAIKTCLLNFNLKTLSLRGCSNISSVQLDYLFLTAGDEKRWQEMEMLGLRGTQFHSQTLIQLIKFPSLKKVYLSLGFGVSLQDIQNFTRKFPQSQIQFVIEQSETEQFFSTLKIERVSGSVDTPRIRLRSNEEGAQLLKPPPHSILQEFLKGRQEQETRGRVHTQERPQVFSGSFQGEGGIESSSGAIEEQRGELFMERPELNPIEEEAAGSSQTGGFSEQRRKKMSSSSTPGASFEPLDEEVTFSGKHVERRESLNLSEPPSVEPAERPPSQAKSQTQDGAASLTHARRVPPGRKQVHLAERENSSSQEEVIGSSSASSGAIEEQQRHRRELFMERPELNPIEEEAAGSSQTVGFSERRRKEMYSSSTPGASFEPLDKEETFSGKHVERRESLNLSEPPSVEPTERPPSQAKSQTQDGTASLTHARRVPPGRKQVHLAERENSSSQEEVIGSSSASSGAIEEQQRHRREIFMERSDLNPIEEEAAGSSQTGGFSERRRKEMYSSSTPGASFEPLDKEETFSGKHVERRESLNLSEPPSVEPAERPPSQAKSQTQDGAASLTHARRVPPGREHTQERPQVFSGSFQGEGVIESSSGAIEEQRGELFMERPELNPIEEEAAGSSQTGGFSEQRRKKMSSSSTPGASFEPLDEEVTFSGRHVEREESLNLSREPSSEQPAEVDLGSDSEPVTQENFRASSTNFSEEEPGALRRRESPDSPLPQQGEPEYEEFSYQEDSRKGLSPSNEGQRSLDLTASNTSLSDLSMSGHEESPPRQPPSLLYRQREQDKSEVLMPELSVYEPEESSSTLESPHQSEEKSFVAPSSPTSASLGSHERVDEPERAQKIHTLEDLYATEKVYRNINPILFSPLCQTVFIEEYLERNLKGIPYRIEPFRERFQEAERENSQPFVICLFNQCRMEMSEENPSLDSGRKFLRIGFKIIFEENNDPERVQEVIHPQRITEYYQNRFRDFGLEFENLSEELWYTAELWLGALYAKSDLDKIYHKLNELSDHAHEIIEEIRTTISPQKHILREEQALLKSILGFLKEEEETLKLIANPSEEGLEESTTAPPLVEKCREDFLSNLEGWIQSLHVEDSETDQTGRSRAEAAALKRTHKRAVKIQRALICLKDRVNTPPLQILEEFKKVVVIIDSSLERIELEISTFEELEKTKKGRISFYWPPDCLPENSFDFAAFLTQNPRTKKIIFTQLRRLPLSGVGLQTIPQILSCCSYPNCEYVDLSNNQLTLPFFQPQLMPLLQTLDLSHNEIISLMHVPLRLLGNLRELNLEKNCISELPGNLLEYCHSLAMLNLSHNQIMHLDENLLVRMNFLDERSQLQEFNVSSNLLQTLPSRLFSDCEKLSVMDISKNRLEGLPQDVFDGCVQCRSINLSYNLLQRLPECLFKGCKYLEKLNLSHNQIVNIPESLFPITLLLELNLSNNRLSFTSDPHGKRPVLPNTLERQLLAPTSSGWKKFDFSNNPFLTRSSFSDGTWSALIQFVKEGHMLIIKGNVVLEASELGTKIQECNSEKHGVSVFNTVDRGVSKIPFVSNLSRIEEGNPELEEKEEKEGASSRRTWKF